MDNYTPFSWGARENNTKELQQYINARIGPYTQYGPTSTAYLTSPAAQKNGLAADFEVFVLPHAYDKGSSDRSHAFSVYLMYLHPQSRSRITLSSTGDVVYPQGLYLGTQQDADAMTWCAQTVIDSLVAYNKSSGGRRLKLLDPSTTSHDAVRRHVEGWSCAHALAACYVLGIVLRSSCAS